MHPPLRVDIISPRSVAGCALTAPGNSLAAVRGATEISATSCTRLHAWRPHGIGSKSIHRNSQIRWQKHKSKRSPGPVQILPANHALQGFVVGPQPPGEKSRMAIQMESLFLTVSPQTRTSLSFLRSTRRIRAQWPGLHQRWSQCRDGIR